MKVVFFAFKGELMCFNHVMLNALDMDGKGILVKIVMEGEAVTLIKALEEEKNELYLELKEKASLTVYASRVPIRWAFMTTIKHVEFR